MKEIVAIIFGILGISVGLFTFINFTSNDKASVSLGSIQQGQEYFATTTQLANLSSITYPRVILKRPGSLAQVTITGAAAGAMYFYDATTSATSGQSGRDPNMSTSSLLVAMFPASAVVGTYTFDAGVSNGLLVDVVGTVPTTTITTR